MTSRQRWLCLLEGKTPDRIPTDYQAVPEFHAKIAKALGCADDDALWRRLHADCRFGAEARCVHNPYPDDPQTDMWGIGFQQIDYGTGVYSEVAHNPLANVRSVSDVHAHTWPTTDWFDYTAVTDAVRNSDGSRVIATGQYEPLLLYGRLRGLEQSYEDLLLDPDIADAILGHIFDFHYEHLRRSYEAGEGRIDVSILAEDLGSQIAPLFSIDVYKRFVLPNQKRMADLMRQYNVRIFYHTDGSARPFLPYLVDEVGIDILNPIQWRCPGMERDTLVRDFGSKVIFHGSMDNQHTLPFGSVDEVIAEVKDNMRYFENARWICAPCHNIQAVSPVENIVAMYQTIRELGQLSP